MSLSQAAISSGICALEDDSTDDTVWATPLAAPRNRWAKVDRAVERGMATAEYAVGILAAVALALVLLRVFTDNRFFTQLLKFVTGLIGKVGSMLPR